MDSEYDKELLRNWYLSRIVSEREEKFYGTETEYGTDSEHGCGMYTEFS